MIKRLMLSTTVIAALLATSGTAFAGERIRAEAELAPIGNSGISAEIRFVDNPVAKTLTIRGRAEGLDPTQTYFSLLYNVGSPSVGPMACEPTLFPPDPNAISDVQMLVGFWDVNREGDGKLVAVKSMKGNTNLIKNAALLPGFGLPPGIQFAPSYVGLEKVGNMSVRNVSAAFLLQACGDLERED